MNYVDAGYAIGLGVLAVYAVSLITRRRRLTRAVARIESNDHGNRTERDR